MNPSRRTFLAHLGVASLLVACAPAAAAVSTSPRDPSNPNAPEGATPPGTRTAAATPPPAATPAPAPAAHDHAGHGDAPADGAAAYVCPMHPEVTSSAPGVCPKCNMKLVPKK